MGQGKWLDGEVFVFFMLADGLDDFVGLEGKSADETVFAAGQKRVIVQLKEAIYTSRYALNSVTVGLDIVSLEYDYTALARGTDDVLAVSHQFHSIEFLVKRFRYGI